MPTATKDPIAIQPDRVDKPLTKAQEKKVNQLTMGLKTKLADTAKNIVLIGKDLNELKDLLAHGDFMPYIEAHFDMSYRSANRFMHVAEVFGDRVEAASQLSQRAMYLLSSPQVPEEAREELLDRVKSDGAMTYDDMLAFIQQQHQAQEEQKSESRKPTLRIKSFSRQISKLHDRVSVGLKGFSGELTAEHREQLKQVQAQIRELESWVDRVLKEKSGKQKKGKKGGK